MLIFIGPRSMIVSVVRRPVDVTTHANLGEIAAFPRDDGRDSSFLFFYCNNFITAVRPTSSRSISLAGPLKNCELIFMNTSRANDHAISFFSGFFRRFTLTYHFISLFIFFCLSLLEDLLDRCMILGNVNEREIFEIIFTIILHDRSHCCLSRGGIKRSIFSLGH